MGEARPGYQLKHQHYYGGQAVIEGVMMRGRKTMVTAVRRPGGDIGFNAQPLSSIYTGRLRKTPLTRGIIVLVESLALGIKSLMYSANMALEEEKQELSGGATWLIMAVALGVAVAVFFVLPLFLTRLFQLQSSLLFNLVDGLIRLAIFVVYMWSVGFIPDIRRTFAYHGAEHKAVNAYEAGVSLETGPVKAHGTAHVRCGTSFLFAVMVIAIVVFSLVGKPSLWLMVLSRIVLIPVIASLGYEVTYFGARHTTNRVVRTIVAPGLWLQRLTTREPDDLQIEVALLALRKVIEIDGPLPVVASSPSS